MKKKIVSALLVVMMGLNMAACGGSDSSSASVPASSVAVEATAAASTGSEQAAAADDTAQASAEEFSLLDVTSDMIEVGIYTTDENQEQVISLFIGPDGNSYISLMQVFADETGDVICGSYDESGFSTVTDEDGTDWTVISFTDVYTGDDCSIVFAEFDDGSVMVSNTEFTNAVEGEYLTADDTIDYMAAAINFIP